MVLLNIALFLLSVTVLFLFGSLLVKSSVMLAKFLRMNEFIAGFIVLAVITSLPELFIGIQSAMAGRPSLSLGNVIGANIANLALIGGIIAVMARKITVASKRMRGDILVMSIIAAIPIALMIFGEGLTRLDGMILILIYATYIIYLWKTRGNNKRFQDNITRWEGVVHTILLIASIYLLNYTAKIVVITAESIAVELALPAIFVGLIFISIGTTLPELAISTRAVLEHHPDLGLGNIMGSVVVNSLLVLGVTAVIAPITANLLLFLTSAIFLIFVVISFALFAFHGRSISWHEGIVLIMFYILFIIVQLNVAEFFL